MTTSSEQELREKIYKISLTPINDIYYVPPGIDGSFGLSDKKLDAIMHLINEQVAVAVEKPISVNRLEVVNHLSDGTGREVVVWKGEPFTVENSIQDGGRTLKVFLTDMAQHNNPIGEGE